MEHPHLGQLVQVRHEERELTAKRETGKRSYGGDWYMIEGDAAGAAVYAIAAGEVVFAGSD